MKRTESKGQSAPKDNKVEPYGMKKSDSYRLACMFCDVGHDELIKKDQQIISSGIGGQSVRCKLGQPFDAHQEIKNGYKYYEVWIVNDDLPSLLWSNEELLEGQMLTAEFSCFQDDAIWLHHPLSAHES